MQYLPFIFPDRSGKSAASKIAQKLLDRAKQQSKKLQPGEMPTVLSDNLSRWQVACISLPVEHASGFRLVNVPLSACSDPDRSPMRIPEHVITKAIQYLQMFSGKRYAVEVKAYSMPMV